jgi:hypothetical protein
MLSDLDSLQFAAAYDLESMKFLLDAGVEPTIESEKYTSLPKAAMLKEHHDAAHFLKKWIVLGQ